MKKIYPIVIILLFFKLLSSVCSAQVLLDSIPDGTGYTYIASPSGPGPFPAVLYNHGGLGSSVGGDLRGTVIALAEAGYIARAEKRMETVPITGHLAEVQTALDSLLSDPRVNINCVTIMGFSRGGYLSLEAAKQNPEKINGIISMAPANPAGLLNSLVTDVSPFDDPILMLVANNDTFQDQHVLLAQMVYDSLMAAGKTTILNVYPDYDSNGDMTINYLDDGHELFFFVQNPYWNDVINFLNSLECNIAFQQSQIKSPDKPKIYSDPLRNQLIVEFQNLRQGSCSLKLYNLQGQLVKNITQVSDNKISIEKDELSKGLYYFQLVINKKIHSSGKISIQ